MVCTQENQEISCKKLDQYIVSQVQSQKDHAIALKQSLFNLMNLKMVNFAFIKVFSD